MTRILRMIVLLFAAVLATAAAPTARPEGRDWSHAVRVTPSGSHLIGNPDAKLKLVEYISYTCPHCAHLQEQSAKRLREVYVRPGSVSLEVRNLVRDPIDLTAATLANCGDPARFAGNHDAFLSSQSRWIEKLEGSTEAQRKRWEGGPLPARLKAMASDFGFYAIMAGRGYDRAAVDRCLADQALIKRLVAQTSGAETLGVNATPSFMLDGAVLTSTYDWATLEPQLQARL